MNMQIDADHSRAICLEIGERLGELMRRDAACELPARLRDLMERLAEADRETSPSLVPCLEDMTQQAPIDPRELRARASVNNRPGQQPLNRGSGPSCNSFR